MVRFNKNLSENEIISFFDVTELEERLENRWCQTTVTNNSTGESETTISRCEEAVT